MPSSRESSYKGSLLFVNRDATNVLQRDEAEAFAVNSHVSSTYRHWFRNNRSGQTLSVDGASASKRSPATYQNRNGNISDRNASKRTTARHLNGFRQAWRASKAPENLAYTRSHHLWPENTQQQNILPTHSPQTLLQSGNSDPFNAAATPMTALHIELINNWQHRYYYYLTPQGASATARQASAQTWQHEVRQSISHEMLLHGIFAGALVFLSAHPSISPAELHRRSIFHQGRCLRLIRESISRGEVFPETLQAVAFAAVLDFFKRDIPACEVHVQAMKSLTDFQGGLAALPVATRPKLYLSDLEIADSCLRRMMFHVSTWGVGSWATEKNTLSAEESMSLEMYETYETSKYHDTLPPHLIPLISHHREVLLVHNLALELVPRNEPLADRIFHWLHTRKLALIATTLDVHLDIVEVSPAASCIEASIPLAINYAQRLIIDARYESIVGIPIHNLARTLAPLSADVLAVPRDPAERVCLLWMLFVGACVEMLRAETMQNPRTWFISRFAVLAREMEITNVGAVECFETFLYDEKALGGLLRRLLVWPV